MKKIVKKRSLSVLCTLIMFCSIFSVSLINVNASGNSEVQVDGSYLTMSDTSTGSTKSGISTRGLHLMDGQCSITKAGSGKIYVYAGTTADHDVDYLSVVMYVERYNETTGSWGQIYFEQATDYNTYFVSTSKMLYVEKGYYYRVWATHVAGMEATPPYDEGLSATDGIWIN